MRKLFFLLVTTVFFAVYLPAQTVVVFHEDFELPSLGDSLQNSSDPSGGVPWAITTHLKNSGSQADSNRSQIGTTVYLTTNSFSTIGYSNVSLQFAQICKLYFSDGGIIEVSVDGGTVWTPLGITEYQGTGNLIQSGGIYKFSDNAYSDWLPGDTLINPTNAWWKTEIFNISSFAANQADVKIRFKFTGSTNPLAAGKYGWLLDDIKVLAANNELLPPEISFKDPILKDTLFVTGPFTVQAYVKDSSALLGVNLIYNINGGIDNTISMTNISDSTYVADIPSCAYDSVINYKIQAIDAFYNTSVLPSGYQSFVIKKGSANVQIGNTTTAGLYSPLYIAGATNTNLYSYNVALFEKNEILSGGVIESLAFSKSDAQGYTLGDATLRIYLKGTSATVVPATYASYLTEKNGAIKVYESNSQNLNTAIGWQTFTCNTGSLFSHNGTENLMVFIEWYRPGDATGAVNWHYTTTSEKSSIFYGTSAVPTTTNTTGQRANMIINFQSSNATYDATVLNFASPTQTMTAGTNVPVTIRVKNLGSATLTKANVHWMVDGVYQGMVNWTGSLPQDFVSSPVALGNVNLAVGPHVLRAWTDLPNDSIDQTPANDTTTFYIFACQDLNGAYTVGSPTSNFPTFTDVFTALANCGITGPVTFRIDSGTYNQQLIIPLINNVSAANTVTFESASGNRDDVVFQYSSTGTADNFVLRLDASEYIKVKNITFKALGTTYGRVVELANTASYNTIEGCKLEMPITTSSNYAGIYTASTIEQYNTFKNNEILNGYYGIYNYGSGQTSLEKGNVIEGNTITGFYYYGIYSYYQDSVIIDGNIIENGSISETVYGINAGYNDNLLSISKNKVYVKSSGTNTTYCLRLYYCDNTATQPGIIANNFVTQSGSTGTVYGLANHYSTYQNYYYNSVNVATGTSTYGAFYSTSGSNINLYNNNFVNTGGGYAYYISTVAAIVNSDYNNLYTTGTNLAYWSTARTSLAALQAASSKDANSISIDPQYASVNDLHVTNFALYGIGTPITTITDDIDGNVRVNPPCIGADEFIVPQNDAGIVLISNPTPMITTLNQDIKVKIKNFGILPLTSATIKWSVNGVMQTPYNWTGNLVTNAVDTVTIGNYTFNLEQSTLKIYSEQPNNVQDVFNLNDTLSVNIYACSGSLSGSYTIGGTGANYSTISEAVLALKNCGVSGPTVFNINSGIYNEQFIIPQITGVSATNTVTFKSADNDSTSVIIDITSGIVGNYVVKFDSTQYVKFSQLTMKNESMIGRVVEIAGNSKYCEVSNCVLKSNQNTTLSTSAVVYSDDSKDEYLVIKNNVILGGYYGIYNYGVSTTNLEKGNIITNNVIKDFYYYGIYSYRQDSVTITSNVVENGSNSGAAYGIYAGYNDNLLTISKNKVYVHGSGSSANYGIYIYYCDNTSAQPGIIANNFVSQSGTTGSIYGIANYYSTYQKYLYNSVNITSGSTTGGAFYSTNGSNVDLYNNIFSNTGGGYAYYISTVAAIVNSDYNNIYATGPSLAYWSTARADLAALKAASSKDANSISVNPAFFSISDLHLDDVALFAKGTTISSITDDIDGQLRTATPCIGADEFVVMPNDAKVKVMYTLGKLPIQAGSPHIVKTIIKNMGTDTLINLNVTLNITGSNTFTNVKMIDTLYSGTEDTIDFDSFIPTSYGLNNVKVSVPSDDVISNNEINYKQEVTDSIFGYADDTSAVITYLGFNTGSGLFVSKYHINGSRTIKSVRAYITNSNTIGQVLYGVVLDENGVILDTSAYKTISATDANTWVTFNFNNLSATTTTNADFYIGFAQTVGTGGYYPLGCQAEVPTRNGAFYYTTNMAGGSFTEATTFGRFMIEANLGLPANKDATVDQIVTPISGCGLSNEMVKINILNIGTDTIFGGQNVLTAYYGLKHNGNLVNVVSQTVTDTILPSQSKEFTFTTPVDMAVTTADSNYNVITWVNLTNDPFTINDTLTKIVTSKYIPPIPIVTTPVNINFNASTTLTATSNDSVYWYTNETDTIPLASGLNYTTPILQDTTTYWVSAGSTAISSGTQFVGPLDNAIGGGGAVSYTTYHEIFDVLSSQGITIKKVDMYPGVGPGAAYTMVVLNSSGSTIASYSGVTTVASGTKETVTVDLYVPQGTDYKIGFTTMPSLYRNTAGATFPYTIPGVISITGNDFSGYPTYYYYIYNWEVSTGGVLTAGCQSPKTPVIVNVAPGSDASIDQILTPNTGCGLSNQTVEVKIMNKGNIPIYGGQNVLTVNYALLFGGNITNTVSQVVPDTILPFDSLNFSFNTPLTLAAIAADSNYTLVAWCNLTNDLNIYNDTTTKAVTSKYTPLAPNVSNVTVPYGSTATINAVSNDSVYWFANINDTVPLASGYSFTTPPLYDTTTYYVQAGQAGAASGGLLITEINIGDPDAIEIQNLNNVPIDATGWVVAVSNSYSDINSVNANLWQLGNISAGQILIKDDNSSGTQYWGSNLYWNPGAFPSYAGWAMIIDNNGNIVDYVVWGWKSADIQGFSATINGHLITIGSKWTGDGIVDPSLDFIVRQTYDNDILSDFVNQSTGTIGTANPNMTGAISGGNGCSSPKVSVTASVSSIPAVDIAATQISEPIGSIITGALTPVKAIITNYGSTTVTTATIKWSVNGVAQPDVPWTGNLLNGQSSTPISLGDYSFVSGPSVIKVWTNNPNGTTDMFPANDTTVGNVLGCFTGTFTIGATGTFPTFNAALTALDSAGICGNVIFDVLPGTYTESVIINQIPNMGPSTTITFRSQNGNNTSVILTSSTGSAVVKLNGADYIRFEKINIKGTGTITAALELSGGANNNIFDGNIIEIPAATTSTYRVINSTSTTTDDNNQFLNNSISGGYYGIYWYGSSSNIKSNNKFIGNTVTNFYYYGIYSYYQDSITIDSNTIENGSNSGAVCGIYAGYNDNLLTISKNKVYVHGSGTSTNYGIYVYYCDNTSAQPGIIANNFVSQSGTTGSIYGIDNYSSTYQKYLYNSVNITSGSTTGGAFYSTSGSNIDLYNNIFSNTGGGYAYYISTVAAIVNSDYNNIYATGPSLAYWSAARTDLAALQTASGKDQNSLSLNPNFFSLSNLHIMNFDLNGKGTPLASVTNDIDGDIRNATTPDIGADEFNLPPNDAGAVAITEPTNPTVTGAQNVKVKIKNFGANNLTSVNIQWSVNGVLQTPYSLTSINVVSGDTISTVVGNYNFTGGLNTIKAWTNLPSGFMDGNSTNDTIEQNIIVCSGVLAGTYTIGGTSANFPTINAAVQSLYYCGISGPVTFNINQGTYNEQLIIDPIPGASATNTITFKSVNNDSNSVVISYAPSLITANYVVKLNGANYIKFKHLSIVNNTQNDIGRVVELTNSANNNEFSNNVIQSVSSTVSTTAGIYSYNTKDEGNIITNNLITGGYSGIYLYGVSTTSLEKGNIIANNVIRDFYYYGIYTYYQDSVIINSNIIENGSNSGVVYGIYAGYNDNLLTISKNKVYVHGSGSSTNYGIYIYYCDNTSAQPGIIANNFVSQSGTTGSIYGIDNYYSKYQKYLYNSVNITSGSTTGGAFYSTNGSNVDLYNNIFTNTGGGYAYYIATVAAIVNSDYNNIYATGPSLAYWSTARADLAALQTASAKDSNSVSLDPDFLTNTDLHVYTSVMNDIGKPLMEVTDDIDGQLRNTTTPDIGADEYTPLPIDIAAIAFVEPTTHYSQAGINIPIKVRIKNLGADSVTNFNVVCKLGNAAPVNYLYTGYLHANQSDTVIFTNQAVAIGPFEIKAYISLATDGNHNNDTTKMDYFGVSFKNVPYAENFDNTTEEWFSLESNSLWEKGVPTANVINTAHSTPNVWATKLNGNYNVDNNISYLYTPIFDNGVFKADTLKFWHWISSEPDWDGGFIEYKTNTGWVTLGSLLPDTNAVNWYNGTNYVGWTDTIAGWHQSKYKISSLTNLGNTIQFRFVFTTDGNTNNYNGWAIDDFELTLAPIPEDAGVIAITSPAATSIVGELVPVTVTIKNFGTSSLSNIPVRYQVGTGPIITETYTGTLTSGATTSYTFTQPYQVANTNYTICAYTEVTGDIYIQNDKTCKNVTVNPAANDVGITEILVPGTSVSPGTTLIKVVIKNFGTQTQTSIPLAYQRGTQTPVDAIWIGSLAAGDTIQYTFATPMNVPLGNSFSLCTYTKLTNDAYKYNDTICRSVALGIDDVEQNNFWLSQNMPNPTTGLTNIEYNLPTAGEIKFDIINLFGQKVYSINEKVNAGKHLIDLNVKEFSAGIYYYAIEFKGKRLVKKMIVNK